MACQNCENGCINPNLCSCDCQSCATAGACDIPAGAPGAQGPQGPQGTPGQPGLNGVDGIDGLNGCTITNVYQSDGNEPPGIPAGHLIVETGNTGEPCEQVFDAGPISGGGAGDGAMPPGVIVMWSGALNAIPDGWLICDGTNGTPDLQGRFVVGRDPTVGSPYTSVGNIGGAATVSLMQGNIPAHTHSLANVNVVMDQGGGHYHSWRGYHEDNGNGSGEQHRSRNWYNTDPLEPITIQPIAPTDFLDPDYGAHTHTASLNPTVTMDGTPQLTLGAGNPFSITPTYYTIAYIMKQ